MAHVSQIEAVPEARGRTMSDEFDSLDAIERAGIEAALNRCRTLAAKIANELRNERPEHFVDKSRWQTFTPPLSWLPGSLPGLLYQPMTSISGRDV